MTICFCCAPKGALFCIDENDTLLMDEHENIRLNYDNPQVREKILNQLRLYSNMPENK